MDDPPPILLSLPSSLSLSVRQSSPAVPTSLSLSPSPSLAVQLTRHVGVRVGR